MHYEPLKRRSQCLHESIRADCCEHRGGVPGAAVAARRACRRRRLRAQLASPRVAHAGFSLVNVHFSIEVMFEAFSFKVSSFCVAMLRRNPNAFSVAKTHVQLQQCISICNLFFIYLCETAFRGLLLGCCFWKLRGFCAPWIRVERNNPTSSLTNGEHAGRDGKR